jgi:2-polyprenyl-3-methyl-5-hydroxy-6-metoxy-1,4-benzoquinol methylase
MASIVDERGYNQVFVPRPAQVIRLRRRAEAIIAALPPAAAGETHRILELGCGLGEMADMMATMTTAHVTGVDLSEKFIAHARATYRRPNLEFLVANLTRDLPSAEQPRYHAITGNGILHHLYHHLDTVLPALHRWLQPGGRLIFWEPNLWNPYVWTIFTWAPFRRLTKLEPDEMAFTRGFIAAKLARAGFTGIRVDTRDFLLPNTPDGLIRPVIAVSDVLDRVPLVNRTAQSLFLVAEKA